MTEWRHGGISPEEVLAWARYVLADVDDTSVIITTPSGTLDGQASLALYDVTGVGSFALVLWGDRDDRPGGRFTVRRPT